VGQAGPGAPDPVSPGPKKPVKAIKGGKKHKLAPPVPFTKEEIAEPPNKGMSPFWSTLVAGGILLSVYVVGKVAYQWFTTRRNGKEEREGGKRRWAIERD
jgi:hypothetical protein